MTVRATVVPDGKMFKVMIGVHEIGSSKTDFDARYHMHAINEALNLEKQVAYREGYNDGHAVGVADGYGIIGE